MKSSERDTPRLLSFLQTQNSKIRATIAVASCGQNLVFPVQIINLKKKRTCYKTTRVNELENIVIFHSRRQDKEACPVDDPREARERFHHFKKTRKKRCGHFQLTSFENGIRYHHQKEYDEITECETQTEIFTGGISFWFL
jgi:hypothetical protein